MQTSPLALYADKTPNFCLNSYVFLSSLAPTLPGFRWGGTPRSGMVVSRPLRRGLPETPSTPPMHTLPLLDFLQIRHSTRLTALYIINPSAPLPGFPDKEVASRVLRRTQPDL